MLKIISGTWEEGNGIIVHDTVTDNFYHLVVYKNSVEIKGNLYYKDDLSLFTCYETKQTMTGHEWFLEYCASDDIDYDEYPSFDIWWADMRKSGVIEEV